MKRELPPRVNVLPQNQRLNPTKVSRQHEFIAKRQQQYVENALKASGIYAIIFKFVSAGKRCTCSGRASLLDNNGDLTPAGLLSITKDIQNVYGETQRVSFKANDLNLDTVDDDIDTDFHEDLEPTSQDLIEFGSFNQDYCGICYGSGYVGGYNVMPGYRLVYDTQSVINTDHILDTSDQPYHYHSGTYAEFETRLPLTDNIKLRVFNNSTEITEFTYDTIPLGTIGTLRIETEQSFTHIELTSLNGYVHTDFSQLPDDFSPNLLGDNANATFIFGYNNSITKNSIIYETKFGRLWQVMTINPFYDNSGVLIQYEVETRLIAQHELYKYLTTNR